jgi:hypothetical protein
MSGWVKRFGGTAITATFVWLVFAGGASWQAIDGTVPSTNVLQWASLAGKIALASGAATFICVAIQWSERIDPGRLLEHWREPGFE